MSHTINRGGVAEGGGVVIPGVLVFLLVAAILLIVLPRPVAVLPLMLASAYTTRSPVVELACKLSVLRILVLVGIVRVFGTR